MEFDIEKSYCTQCEITGVYRDSRGENPNRFLFLYRKNEIKYSENGNEFEVAVETRDFTKELAIKAKTPVPFRDVLHVLLEVIRFENLFDGRFYPFSSFKVDNVERIETIKWGMLAYLQSVCEYSCFRLIIENSEYLDLFKQWIEYSKKYNFVNQVFLYSTYTNGMPVDMRLEHLLEVFEPLESKLHHSGKIQRPKQQPKKEERLCPNCGLSFVELNNAPYTLHDRISTIVDNFGAIIFNGDNVPEIISRAKNTRDMVAHVARKNAVLSSDSCAFYLQKFSLLYRYIVLREIGLETSVFDDEVQSLTESLNHDLSQWRIVNTP